MQRRLGRAARAGTRTDRRHDSDPDTHTSADRCRYPASHGHASAEGRRYDDNHGHPDSLGRRHAHRLHDAPGQAPARADCHPLTSPDARRHTCARADCHPDTRRRTRAGRHPGLHSGADTNAAALCG